MVPIPDPKLARALAGVVQRCHSDVESVLARFVIQGAVFVVSVAAVSGCAEVRRSRIGEVCFHAQTQPTLGSHRVVASGVEVSRRKDDLHCV